MLDQPIYNGRYWIGSDETCVGYEITLSRSLKLSPSDIIDLGSDDGVNYSGIYTFDCAPPCPLEELTNRGNVELTIDGSIISYYTWDNPAQPCFGGPDISGGICTSPCPFSEQGEGTIVDELILEINFTNEDCQLICEGKRFYVRQG